jgi:HlyD family secretion protein
MKVHRLQTLFCAVSLTSTLALAGCSSDKTASDSTPTPAVRTQTAKTQAIEDVVQAQGILYPIHQASISPKISAPVETFFVNRGSRVHKGELLAVLANKDLKAGVVSAQGAYDQARANYETTTKATLPEQIQNAEAAVQNAKKTLDQQQRLFESDTNLYNEGAIARKQLDATSVALTSAENAFDAAEKHLNILQSSSAKLQQQAAQGQMESAHGQYLSAQAQLGFTEIRSPIDGSVADRSVWPGDIAPAGTPLLIIMDISKVVLRIHIPQEQAAQLHLGDSATLHVPGLDAGVPAKVTVISPALDPNSTTVEVWLLADNPDRKLTPGTSVGASIVVRKVSNALTVPESAILVSDKGKDHVMTVGPDNTAHDHPVVTGIRNNGFVQILNGIQAGDQVIITGNFGLPDNSKVKPQPESDRKSTGGQN